MGRPKKADALDRRASVRLSDETYQAYEEIAQLIGVPAGQLMRQVLTLEAQELRVLIGAMQGRNPAARPFAEADSVFSMPYGGGLSQHLRRELLNRQVARVQRTPAVTDDAPAGQ